MWYRLVSLESFNAQSPSSVIAQFVYFLETQGPMLEAILLERMVEPPTVIILEPVSSRFV